MNGNSRLVNAKGSAYIFTMIISMLLLITVAATLAVASPGRMVTARYLVYSNLYDIAAAGNERVLFWLNCELEKSITEISAENQLQYKSKAKELLDNHIRENFNLSGGVYRKTWEVSVSISPTDLNGETYHGTTEIIIYAEYYKISTSFAKTVGGAQSYPTLVEAEIIWKNAAQSETTINNFDDITLGMIKSKKIAN